MADCTVAEPTCQIPEIDNNLEAVLIYVITEARTRLEDGDELVPFTALAVGDTLFIESHPANTAEECFGLARHAVQGAAGAVCYALCYDGYVDTDEGQKDAIIAEGGLPGQPEGHAVGLLYSQVGEDFEFASEVVYIGTSPNFMMALAPASGTEGQGLQDPESQGSQAPEGPEAL